MKIKLIKEMLLPVGKCDLENVVCPEIGKLMKDLAQDPRVIEIAKKDDPNKGIRIDFDCSRFEENKRNYRGQCRRTWNDGCGVHDQISGLIVKGLRRIGVYTCIVKSDDQQSNKS